MKKPTVSVILCNYNHARYLPQSLGGIVGQTRPADQIIVVDDGSKDDSLAVIKSFAAKHSNILVLPNHKNMGLQFSISRALGAVSSRYLVWAAADDLLLPDFLDESLSRLEKYPQAGLCFSEVSQLIGDTGRIERFATNPDISHIFNLDDLPEYLTPAALRARMRRAYLAIYGQSIVCRFNALLACDAFIPQLEWHSDMFAFYSVAARYGACVVPKTLALSRVMPETYSISGMRNEGRQRAVVTKMLAVLRRREFRDIRAFFRACPAYFSPCGTLMLRVMLGRPRDYDLAIPYLLWKLREYKRGRRLTWSQVATGLTPQLMRFTADRLRARRARS